MWMPSLNPTPSFPAYTGPYKVGTVDVEIPVSELNSPSPAPSPSFPTIAFRIFYPCPSDSQERSVKWIPSPQREYIGAYARFLGANNVLSQLFSLIPQLLYFVSIPVHNNARLLTPSTSSKRWPVLFFSHGLGGSRNSYSHMVGSLASHGLVVIAPDHRDGSSPISVVHTPGEKQKVTSVDYQRISHKASTQVYESRDAQLRVRLWEMGLIHDAVLKLDEGVALSNVLDAKKRADLGVFKDQLDVHEPGSISFAGHSFGAATTVQFLKSVYYHSQSEVSPNYRPLYTPASDSAIVRQITPRTSAILLDLWALPIQSQATSWLKAQPMPCYHSSAIGGSNLLAILSEGFFKWTANLEQTKDVVAKPASAAPQQSGPHIFYPIASAHLSQSDFGILFPWLTAKVFGAKEPERVLKLNVRAILQVLRRSGVEVANTSVADLELKEEGDAAGALHVEDETILSTKADTVRGWVSLGTAPSSEPVSNSNSGPSGAMVESETLGEIIKDQER